MPRIAQGADGAGPQPAPPSPPPAPQSVSGGRYIAPREVRQEMVGKLILQRFSYEEISQRLGLTHEQVEEQARKMKTNWEAMRIMATADRIEQEIAQLELARSEAWIAWERSKENAVEKSRKLKTEGRNRVVYNNQNIDESLPTIEVIPERNRSTKITGRDGNPAFLNIVLSCSAEIRKLLGIDAPEVKQLNIKADVEHRHSFEELVQMDPARLAELHRAALSRSGNS